MSFRFSALATGVLVAVAVVLMSSLGWAYYYPLGPSKDEWGLKYDAEVTTATGDKLNVNFTLADQGRLKPIYSASLVVFSNPDSRGVLTCILNVPIELKPTKEGKLSGQAQIGKEFADRAMIRILSQWVDGQPQTAGARYYEIPLKKFLKKAPAAPSSQAPPSIASPPASKVTK